MDQRAHGMHVHCCTRLDAIGSARLDRGTEGQPRRASVLRPLPACTFTWCAVRDPHQLPSHTVLVSTVVVIWAAAPVSALLRWEPTPHSEAPALPRGLTMNTS